MTVTVTSAGARRVGRREWAALAGLALVAGLLRLWRLGALPPGLHVDEAYNLLDARAVLAGWRPVFLPANAGREVLFTYLQAPVIALLGESPAAARLVPALAGTLLVPVTWALARALPVARPRRVALVAAALVGGCYWHLHFSRFGIRAVLLPLVAGAAMWVWWRTVVQVARPDGQPQPKGIRHPPEVVPHGALLGLACYVHPLGRLLWLVPALDALWHRWRRHDPRPALALFPALIIGAVVALPLVGYWWQHPGSFAGHAGEVSIVSQGPAAVATNAVKVAAMFNIAGDPQPWRNLTVRPWTMALLARAGVAPAGALAQALRGRPVFDPLTGLAFLAGVAMTFAAAGRGAAWASLVLAWLAVTLVPSVFTDAAPNFSRTIGAIAPACLIAALALDALADRLARRWTRNVATGVVVLWAAMATAWTARDYFGTWAGDPATVLAFDGDKVALGRFADARAALGRTVYAPADLADHPTVRVVARTAPRAFDPAHGLVLPPGAGTPGTGFPADYVLAAGDPAWDVLRARLGPALSVAPLGGDARLSVAPDLARGARHAPLDGRFALGTLSLPRGLPVEPYAYPLKLLAALRLSPGAVTFGQAARLLYARAEPLSWRRVPEGSVSAPARAEVFLSTTVNLVWEVVAPTATELSAMVHLGTPDGRGLAAGDGGPVGGSYPTTKWRSGEVVFDTHQIAATVAASALPDGRLELRVGWYDWRTGDRIPVTAGPVELLREDGTAVVAATLDRPWD